jgi:hypothetical protein
MKRLRGRSPRGIGVKNRQRLRNRTRRCLQTPAYFRQMRLITYDLFVRSRTWPAVSDLQSSHPIAAQDTLRPTPIPSKASVPAVF